MNNDTTALQERIARALVVAMECEGTMIEVPEGDEIWCMTHDDGIENGEWCRYVAHAAAAVLPAIEEEVRAAKAEAWTDCVSEASALGWLHAPAALDMLDRNPHEKED